VVPIAEGNAKRVCEEAKAFAQQIVLKATGETAGFLQLLPEYNRDPYVLKERMYLDVMEQILQKSTKVMVDGKSNALLYLPLDKLMAKTIVDAGLKGGMKPDSDMMQAQNTTNSTILEGRPMTRLTEQEGRTN